MCRTLRTHVVRAAVQAQPLGSRLSRPPVPSRPRWVKFHSTGRVKRPIRPPRPSGHYAAELVFYSNPGQPALGRAMSAEPAPSREEETSRSELAARRAASSGRRRGRRAGAGGRAEGGVVGSGEPEGALGGPVGHLGGDAAVVAVGGEEGGDHDVVEPAQPGDERRRIARTVAEVRQFGEERVAPCGATVNLSGSTPSRTGRRSAHSRACQACWRLASSRSRRAPGSFAPRAAQAPARAKRRCSTQR